jgi:hypothetical protein
MKWILRHPVWSGVGFEAVLATLFLFFPVGPCNAPTVGVAVVILHYPAGIFVERVLGIDFSGAQLLLSAALMIPVWICVLLCVRRIPGVGHHKSSQDYAV